MINWRRVWRYQRGNQNPYIREEHTTQWPKEKVQRYKQRSTKHTHKAKNRVTRTPLKTGVELRCSWRISSSCSISGTRPVNLVTKSVICIKWTGKCLRQVEMTWRSVSLFIFISLYSLCENTWGRCWPICLSFLFS